MAFPPQFLDEIRTRLTLSDIVGRRVKLTRKGREHTGLCPFHNEKTPSFTVNDLKAFYHCFGCGSHGDVIGFVMQTEGLTFPEAVERLAGEAGLEVPVATPEERARETKRAGLIEANEAAARFYQKTLWSADGRQALAYLRDRGLTDETIRRFRLGFAPGGNALRGAIMSDEMPEALLLEAGLMRRPDDGRSAYDFFRDRAIFPIADARGRVIAFGGRTMGDGEPKYLNSPDTPLFDKRRTLYGIATARKAAYDKHRLIVTEGYMDVIALAQAGFEEAVAPLGTALTESHLEIMWKLADEPVLCFDGDNAGMRAAGRAAERALPLLAPGKSLRFVTLPAGEDPDSLVRAQGADAFAQLLERAAPLDAVVWSLETEGQNVDTPERRAGLEKRLNDRVHEIADRSVQFQYQALFRDRMRALTASARTAGGRNFGGGKQKGGRFADRSSYPSQGSGSPAAALRARGGPALLRRRQEQVLLATALNHPAVLEMFAEDLAMVNFSDPNLDKLRQEILKLCADKPELDSEGYKDQLTTHGYAESLRSVLGQDVYVHAAFARESAEEEAARAGFVEVLARHLEPRRRAELEEARHVFVNDPTDENWARFEKLKIDGRRDAETSGQGGTELPHAGGADRL